jgi:hypothetical protein
VGERLRASPRRASSLTISASLHRSAPSWPHERDLWGSGSTRAPLQWMARYVTISKSRVPSTPRTTKDLNSKGSISNVYNWQGAPLHRWHIAVNLHTGSFGKITSQTGYVRPCKPRHPDTSTFRENRASNPRTWSKTVLIATRTELSPDYGYGLRWSQPPVQDKHNAIRDIVSGRSP